MSVIDMTNIPGGAIAGLGDEDLNWVSKESMDRMVIELDESFWKDFEFDSDSNAILPEDLENEMKQFENDNVPHSTRESTKRYVNNFKKFLTVKKLNENIETVPVKFLAKYLQYYYFTLRKNDGGFLSPSTLKGIRAGLQRYLTSPEVNRPINIMKDKEFDRANGILKGLVAQWLKSGNKAKQFCGIQPSDLQKLKSYFDRSNATVMQEEVWFWIVYQFGLRGRELLASFTKDLFLIGIDSDGFRYVEIRCDLLSKNVKASLSQKEYENLRSARIYENKEDSEKCIVGLFQEYLKKIPDGNQYLFPLPLKIIKTPDTWYCDKKHLGKDALGQMMKKISKKSCLSTLYTNHCVRVTTISNLSRQGYSSEQISTVSGHKNVNSVQRYVRRLHDCDKRKISEDLRKAIDPKVQIIVGGSEQISDQEISCITSSSSMSDANISINFNGTFNNCVFHLQSKDRSE